MQASIVRIPSPQLVDPTKKNRGIEYYFIASTFLNTALASSPRVLLALPRLLLLPRRDADGKPRLYQHRHPTLSPLSLSLWRAAHGARWRVPREVDDGDGRAGWPTTTGTQGGRRPPHAKSHLPPPVVFAVGSSSRLSPLSGSSSSAMDARDPPPSAMDPPPSTMDAPPPPRRHRRGRDPMENVVTDNFAAPPPRRLKNGRSTSPWSSVFLIFLV